MLRSSNRLIFCKNLRHPRILSRGKATADLLSRNLSFWCGKPADTIARAMAQIPRRTLPATSIK